MGFFKRLFGGPSIWIVRSLDELVEKHPIPVTSVPWPHGVPTDLAVGGGVAAVIASSKGVVTIDARGAELAMHTGHEKAVRALAVHPRGTWVASAEEDVRAIHLFDARGEGDTRILATEAPVSALAFDDGVLIAGLTDGSVEIHPFGDGVPAETRRIQFAESFFKQTPRVSCIDVSPRGGRIAVIIGGVLFDWHRSGDGHVDATVLQATEFMAARFSPDGRYLAAVGGHRDIEIKFGSGGTVTTFRDPRGYLYLRHTETGEKTEVRGEGYWIQNVLWSASGEWLVLFPSVAPETSGPWSKAIALHKRSAVLDGSSIPESVTRLATDVETSAAGYITPGCVLMYGREGDLLRLYDIGSATGEMSAHTPDKASASGTSAADPAASVSDAEAHLDAIVVIFNREFTGQEAFVNEILGQLKTRGRTYREWMQKDTRIRVKSHPDAQDEMTAATMALIEFRKLGVKDANLRRVLTGTFEGSQGVAGTVLSHWS